MYRSTLLNLLRVGVLCCVIVMIHQQHRDFLLTRVSTHQAEAVLPQLQKLLPDIKRVEAFSLGDGTSVLRVLGEDQRPLGLAANTSPGSDHIIGFSGPTELLIVLTNEQRVRSITVLRSADTREHVRQVLESGFLGRLEGLTLNELRDPRVDVVSGATLTSLAILESIRNRLQSDTVAQRPLPPKSLKFPDSPRLEHVQKLFASAQAVRLQVDTGLWDIVDNKGISLGKILRSSPASDNVVGYQGPSDTLIAVEANGQVQGMVVGGSFDNEPYVDYVRQDKYFRSLFNGRSIHDLSTLDIDEARIEGVSGATMTSMAVAEGLPLAARWYERQLQQPSEAEHDAVVSSSSRLAHWPLLSWRSLSTVAISLWGVLIGLTRLKRVPWFRQFFQLVLIGWLGFVNGDMLSQAMFVGWAQNGIPWRNATGLVALTVIAVVLPLSTGKNVYCAHLCPHGAVQQLLRNRLPWGWRLPKKLEAVGRLVPFALLAWVVTVAMLHLPASLVDIEPFDAWVWTIAGPSTLAIAFVGLGCSLFLPMAYCRYGCPTGKLLDFMRSTSHGKWTWRDTAAVVLLGLVIALWFWGT